MGCRIMSETGFTIPADMILPFLIPLVGSRRERRGCGGPIGSRTVGIPPSQPHPRIDTGREDVIQVGNAQDAGSLS
jgi:hypothetical protein